MLKSISVAIAVGICPSLLPGLWWNSVVLQRPRVNVGARTQQLPGAASTGVVLVVELVEGGVHTQRRSSLIPNDGSVGHAGHAQRDELRFVVQSFGELVDAQVAGAGPSWQPSVPRLYIIVSPDAAPVATPGVRRPQLTGNPCGVDVVCYRQQRRWGCLRREMPENAWYIVAGDERQGQQLSTVAVYVASILLILPRQADTAAANNKQII